MKKVLFLIIAAVMTITSCELERSTGGSLDGFWQFYAADTLQGGGRADMRQSAIFWAVQAKLLEMSDLNNAHPAIFFRFEHTGSSLILTHPVVNAKAEGDSLLTDPSLLLPYGLTRLVETLHVVELTDERMTLESQLLRMHFRKY